MSNTYTKSEFIHSIDVFKNTIPLMRGNDIPLTPKNYELWYTYANGEIDGLTEAIKSNLEEGVHFFKKINKALYEQFIEHQDAQALGGYQSATKDIIENLLKELNTVSGGSCEFVDTMEACEKQLLDSPNVVRLTEIINKVVVETKSINELNRGLIKNITTMEQEVISLRSGVKSLTEQANTDLLTKVANRRGFEAEFDLLQSAFKESGSVFSLLLLDIDHFKKI